MESLMDNLGPLALVVVALFGAGFLKKYKNNQALKDHDDSDDEINRKEGEFDAIMKEMQAEDEMLNKLREKIEKEQNREITDEELKDFFDKRYDN